MFQRFPFQEHHHQARYNRPQRTGYMGNWMVLIPGHKYLLDELGYEVRESETLDNITFYIFSTQGDLDFGF